MLSQTEETGKNQQPGRAERSAVRSEKWVQMEESAQRIQRLARDLHPDKPLSEKRCFRNGFSAFTATGNYSNPGKCGQFVFNLH